MSTTTHTCSIYVDAPVEKVLDCVKPPHSFFETMSEEPASRVTGRLKAELTDVAMTPDGGVGTTWSFRPSFFTFRFDAVLTWKEFALDERIVDHSDRGVTWTSTFAPDDTGTTFTLACAVSTKH